MCNALTVRVEEPCPPGVRVIEELLRDVLGPDDDTERVMVPENPLRLVRDIVDPAEDPLETVNDDGLAAMLKSPVLTEFMVTVTVV